MFHDPYEIWHTLKYISKTSKATDLKFGIWVHCIWAISPKCYLRLCVKLYTKKAVLLQGNCMMQLVY